MERQFRINWAALIEEAKQRRKTQKLTQSRLAEMAGVSTPTISRFENGEKDIQLSTVISILTVLGMNDQRHLIFPEPGEYYDPMRMAVVFTGRDGDRTIRCEVSREVLADYFDGDGKDLLKVFQANHEKIEHEVRRKYLSENIGLNESIYLTSKDMG